MSEKKSNGDVILVKNLFFKTREGVYYGDPHGFYSGRPCVIIGQEKDFYYICSITSNAQKSIGFRNCFYLGPNMITPAEDYFSIKHKAGFVKLGDIHQTDDEPEYLSIYTLNKLTYLKLLESILIYHEFYTSSKCCEKSFFPALISIDNQFKELKRELKIQI